MTNEAILQDLCDIIKQIFDEPTLELSADTPTADVDGWDSLEQINILAACEQHFKMKFKIEQLRNIKKVGDIAAIIETNLA